MGDLKTLLGAFAVALCLAPPVSAGPDPVRLFATCAGRLSAVMEHQWMFDGPESERTKAQRAAMIDMLEAVMPAGKGREVLALRIDAKLAQAALLTRATFNDDRRDMQRAQRLALQRTSECTGLLLS